MQHKCHFFRKPQNGGKRTFTTTCSLPQLLYLIAKVFGCFWPLPKAYYNRNKATHTMDMSLLERTKRLRSTRRNQKHALAFDHSLHPFKEVQAHSQHSIGDLMQRGSQQIGNCFTTFAENLQTLNRQKQRQRWKLTTMTSTTTIATRTTWATGGTRARTCDKSDNQEEAVSSTSSNNNNSISKCPNFDAMKERYRWNNIKNSTNSLTKVTKVSMYIKAPH